ncbi:MAG TPA: outer membrane beta-barrel protein [Chitinophagaceae bacterium]|nr:outer membrane beta-barrel protein [Chitinophagaceae bacterium]
MKISLLAILLWLVTLPFTIYGQDALSSAKGEITGYVLDARTGAPMPYVSVTLLDKPDSAALKGIQSGADGRFEFDGLPYADYSIRLSYLGFGTTLVTNLLLRREKAAINAGDISLSPSSKLLGAVTVLAHKEKPLIEDNGDMITYNVGESITNTGTVALDVLGKVPLVMVDAQGNVTLEGQKPTILIDGKPSELGANAINDILESLPADAIDHIEVMENPPAKYQSEGGGGVINIVLKKNRRIGFNGRVSLTAGSLGHYNGNLYLNYRNKNSIFTGILSGDYRKTLSSGYTDRETYLPGDTLYTNQQFSNNNQSFSPYARINLDHDFDPRNNINITLSATSTNGSSSSYTTSDNLTRVKELASILERTNSSSTNNLDYGMNLNFTHKFKNPQEDITAGISFSPRTNFNNSQFTQVSLDSSSSLMSPDSTDRIFDSDPGHQFSVNLDYEKPLRDKKSTLSFGYRGDFQLNSRNYLTQHLDPLSGQFTKEDSASDQLQYFDNVQAVYGQFSSSFKNFFYRVGARLEYTETNFNLFNGNTGYRNTYLNLFPDFSFGRRIASIHGFLHFEYNMRIDRPGLSELNPFVYYLDPYNISYGNPDLKPSTVQNFRLIFGHFSPEGIFGFHLGFNYAYQGNISKQVTTVNNKGVAAASYQNVASGNTYGMNMFFSFRPTDHLNISAFGFGNLTSFNKLDTFNILLSNAERIGINSNISYVFSRHLNAEVSLSYSKATTGQGVGYENFTHSIALQYTFMKQAMNLVFKAIDPFHQQQTFSAINEANFSIFTHTDTRSRFFSLTWSYRFDRIGGNNLDKQKQENFWQRREKFHRPPSGGPPPGIRPGQPGFGG